MPHREPVHGSARLHEDRLTITVKGKPTVYTVSPIDADPRVAYPAYTLTKDDGTEYHIGHCEWGPTCDCPDWIYCREHKDHRGCRHICGLRACGLLPALMRTLEG